MVSAVGATPHRDGPDCETDQCPSRVLGHGQANMGVTLPSTDLAPGPDSSAWRSLVRRERESA